VALKIPSTPSSIEKLIPVENEVVAVFY